ncbi:hypothetical protein D9M68_755340 [compost metagenome]
MNAQAHEDRLVTMRQAAHGALHRQQAGAGFGNGLGAGRGVREAFQFNGRIAAVLPGPVGAQAVHRHVAGDAKHIGLGAVHRIGNSAFAQPQPGVVQAVAGLVGAAQAVQQAPVKALVVGHQAVAQQRDAMAGIAFFGRRQAKLNAHVHDGCAFVTASAKKWPGSAQWPKHAPPSPRMQTREGKPHLVVPGGGSSRAAASGGARLRSAAPAVPA